MACRESLAIGAYLVGALDPAECSALERHMARCADCRAELLELEPLIGLLRRVPFEGLPQTASARTRPAMDTGHADTVQALSRAGRRSRIRRVLIAWALAAVVAGTGFAVYLSAHVPRPTTARPAVTAPATDAVTHVTASAALTPDTTGTSILLRLSGQPPAVTCRLVVHARDGRTETATSWASDHTSRVNIPGSTSLAEQDIARIDVVTSGGRLLVELQPQ
jgi:hypothetical protein